jgi:sec-independent protein translocase protein TatB
MCGQVSLAFMGIPPTIEYASLGMADSLILMVLALVVFGPRRLPQIGRQIGKLMYEFRKASNDFKYQMEEELRIAEDADRKKKEEEQLSTLALAAPAQATGTDAVSQVPEANPHPSNENLSPGTPGPGAPNLTETSGAESTYPGKDPYPAASETGTQPEEVYPSIQPPSTGEQVPAARPTSQATQVEEPATASEADSTTVSLTEQAAQHG